MDGNEHGADRAKEANRELYDAVADKYEEIDGRRSDALQTWLRRNLASLRDRAPGGQLLDLGSGSGLVARCAEGIFNRRIGVDISSRILAWNRGAFDGCAAADVDRLPFPERSFDVATCFAVLHHLYGHERLVPEVARVLRPGGLFYSDHDMDAAFHRRFRIPLWIYRRLRCAKGRYKRASPAITDEIYERSEVHETGIDTAALLDLLKASGLSAGVRFHWFGLTWMTDRLFGARSWRRGWAPLVSVSAVRTGVETPAGEEMA